MFALGALCVLLPLVAALETCDQSKAAAFLANKQLEGNLLDNFEYKKIWFVASGAEGAGDHISTEVTFGSVNDNTVSGNFVYKNPNGETSTHTNTYTVDGDHIVTDKSKSLYFFQCSEHLIAAYRCQVEGTSSSGNAGAKYFVWATLDKTEADVSGELDSCLSEITSVEASATFVRRSRP